MAQRVAPCPFVRVGLHPKRPPRAMRERQDGSRRLPRADDEVAKRKRRDRQRVGTDRLLLGDPKPADRLRTLVLADVFGGARGLLAVVHLLREKLIERQRRALHVELKRLTVGQPRRYLTERC